MIVEDIQHICRLLPGITENIKWEHDLVFSIGGKMFCVVGLDQSPTTASFKVKDEEFEEMSNLPGFKPAPYVAKYKWVWIEDINKMKKTDWKKYLQQSYELVSAKLPAKLKKGLPETGFLSALGAPARRALENKGIKTLKQLSHFSEKEILQLHGMGKTTIPKLKDALKTEGLKFKAP